MTARGPGKRCPLNMRTTAELRGRIEQAAAASGRSMAQEVEYRLELSFYLNLEDQLSRIYGPIARRKSRAGAQRIG